MTRNGRLVALGVRALVLGAAGLSATVATPATAGAHYYAEDDLFGRSFLGAYGEVQTNNFGIGAVASNFTDNEVWVVDPRAGTWEEAGLDKGIGGYGCPDGTDMYFFWADERPGSGGYHCHQSTATATYGKRYGFEIDYLGAGDWRDVVGTLSGNSTGAQTSATLLEAGLESTTTGVATCGYLSRLGYLTAKRTNHTGWSDASDGDGEFGFEHSPLEARWEAAPTELYDASNEPCAH